MIIIYNNEENDIKKFKTNLIDKALNSILNILIQTNVLHIMTS